MSEHLTKLKSINAGPADAAADLALINQFAKTPLTAEQTYCFSVNACDTDVDRDDEFFSAKCLKSLAKLFVGKPVIMDHSWSAKNQCARIYRAQVEDTGKTTSYGEPLQVLRVDCYMLRNEETEPTIEAIEAGILKEVSVGVATTGRVCSICGKALKFSWDDWVYKCEKGHMLHQDYDEGHCSGRFDDAVDAYELSFVAVPAQRAAGVRSKSGDDKVLNAFTVLLSEDISEYPEQVQALISRLSKARLSIDERKKRAQIIEENKKYLKGDTNHDAV